MLVIVGEDWQRMEGLLQLNLVLHVICLIT